MDETHKNTETPTPADAESLAAKLRELAATLSPGEQSVLAGLLDSAQSGAEVRGFTSYASLFSSSAIIIVGGKTRRRRKMSAKARVAISKAQKARWAKQKAGEK